MATPLRRTVTKWGTIALFSLLIASFALWGIGDIFRGGAGGQTVIEVGDRAMDSNTFARAFQQRFDQARQRFGGNLDIATARQIGLVDQILQQIVTEELFEAHAQSMGLVVSDDQIIQEISQQEAFRNSQGQFDRARFQQTLRMSGMTEQDYIDLVRTDISRRHLVDAATGGVVVPDVLAEMMFRHRTEKRVADYVLVEDGRFEVADPTAEDLRGYYEENGDAFMAPAYRELTVIRLTPDQMVDEVRITEEELRSAYEERRDEYHKPERRHVRQVLLDDEATARTAVEKLRAGASLQDVAQELTGHDAVDLGLNRREDLLPALSDAAFALEKGAISEPVETTLGWHVLTVREVVPPETTPFEAVKDELRKKLAKDRAVDSLVSLANALDDELAAGASLEETANALGLKTRHIPAVDRQGRAPDGEPVENLPEDGDFLSVAFETPEGQQSLLEETGAGGYYVLRVDSVTPPQRRPFEAVREEVRQQYLADARRKKARELAQEIRKAVENGTPFEEAADAHGLFVQTTEPLGREQNRQASPAGQAVAGALFDVEPGGIVTGTTENGVAVAQLAEIKVADPAERGTQFNQLETQLRGAVRSDVLAQFVDALRARHEVRVNQALMNEVLNQFQ